MIFDGDMNVVAGAAQRWQERAAIREEREGQSTADIEDSRRIQARLDRLANVAAQPVVPPTEAVLPQPDLLREIGLERVIGQNDFQGIAFLELALAVSRFVGRINIRSSRDRGEGFGTGFMVSPRLLMTNNHVLSSSDLARFSEVEFDYQFDRYGRPLPVVPFALQPELFFMTDVDLDFSLVAVADQSKVGSPLTHYGWSRLIGQQGKILIGEHLNIIQHPRGQFKQFVSRSNELVDVLEKHLHYVTDTEPGSSGSPVYNDQWEVVALHHSGVPRMINGDYASKSGGRWDGRDPNDIEWIANEGIRVSSLVRFIEAQQLNGEQARLRDDLLNLEPPSALEAAKMADANVQPPDGTDVGRVLTADSAGTKGQGSCAVTMTIPLKVTVELGEASIPKMPATPGTPGPSAKPTPTPRATPPSASTELTKALAELERAPSRTYYDRTTDARVRDQYYDGIDAANLTPARLFQDLSALLRRTHRTELRYAPAVHVYPWVDLRHSNPPTIKSIYSGKGFDPRELIEADFKIDFERLNLRESLGRELRPGNDDWLEATLPYNCEHVVPQSWFAKREPMRGDLHHLFACESGCNSFRGNHAYFDFPDFEEALRTDCGKRETGKFEPSDGKGPVARATLYFLLRYPGIVGDSPGELTSDRLTMLLEWHRRDPVGEYERHRNAAIAEKQGNRNPLIDYPEWADRIDFRRGIGRAPGGEEVALEAVGAKIAALEDQMLTAEAEEAAVEAAFGRFDGMPVQLARIGERTARLLAPICYFQDSGVEWPVPEGAVVDGASIPQPFWSVIGGPWEGKYVEASIVHDHYCDTRSRSWRDTHRMFYEAMRSKGVGKAKAKVMYYAVYRFGPRWPGAEEAIGGEFQAGSALAISDAASIVADAEAIYAHDLNLDEIENLAEARNSAPSVSAEIRTEAESNLSALARARLLVVTGGTGTAEDLEVVARDVATLPSYVMSQFERKKIRIVACRESVTDFETSLRRVTPRGWEGTGRTWDDVPGTYLDGRKRVVIATIASVDGRIVPPKSSGKHGSVSLAVHESLHGYDYSGGHAVLRDPRFLEARQRDIGGLDTYQRQPGQAGLEETFAESGSRFIAEPGRFREDCPNLFGYWQSQPAAIEAMTTILEISVPLPEPSDDEDRPIGIMVKCEDGSIQLDLRAEGPGGAVGHAVIDLYPNDPAYGTLRDQLVARATETEATGRVEGLYRPFPAAPGARPRRAGVRKRSSPTR